MAKVRANAGRAAATMPPAEQFASTTASPRPAPRDATPRVPGQPAITASRSAATEPRSTKGSRSTRPGPDAARRSRPATRQPTPRRDEGARSADAGRGTVSSSPAPGKRTGDVSPSRPPRRKPWGKPLDPAAAATAKTAAASKPAASRPIDTAGVAAPAGKGAGLPKPGTPGKAATAGRTAPAATSTSPAKATASTGKGAGARGDKAARAAEPGAAKGRSSALRDLSRPIARDSRMAERRPIRIGYGVIAVAIAVALVAALVVLPVRRWWNQRDELADRQHELEILQHATGQLQQQVDALNTPEGKEAAARDDLNFGFPGEGRTSTVGDLNAPYTLPAGYPYTLVGSLLQTRAAIVASASTTAAPDPVTEPSAAATTPASVPTDAGTAPTGAEVAPPAAAPTAGP